jgi:hypothetical protein
MTLSDSRRHRRPWRRRGRDPRAKRASPDDPHHPSGVPCPLPRWTAVGASVGCFPTACSLPRFPAGSASTTSLSRPAQASLALRPVGSLSRPRRPSSRGFDPLSCPSEPLVSYQINRQLPGWNLPPLATRAVWAHWEIRDTCRQEYCTTITRYCQYLPCGAFQCRCRPTLALPSFNTMSFISS